MSRHFLFAIIALFATASDLPAADDLKAGGDAETISKAKEVFFHAKVLPLLQARCFECHDRSEELTEIEDLGGSLLLSSRKAMLVGGDTGPAIVPGRPDESLLIQAIRYDGYEMPPRSKMPAEEIAIFEKWVEDGAHFPENLDSAPEFHVKEFPLDQRAEDHWAWHFHPDQVEVPNSDDGWATTNIDRFVLDSLIQQDLTPAKDADRATLIRRLSFDLTGLPPTIKQITAFTQDPRPTEQVLSSEVDRLLDSPAFGEHWGRHWLDLVRYADTLGHEFDYPLHDAWKYRDYVIRALNEDVPYDQFVKEHLAGDLLPNPRRHPEQRYNESIIGTGFWFLHENKHAPVDVRGEEAAIIDNQIDVFSKTFLGMTLACARCHDHKFDAISTADYYAMSGYLQSSRRQSAWLDPDQKIERQLQRIAQVKTGALKDLDQPSSSEELRNHISKHLSVAIQALNPRIKSPVQLSNQNPDSPKPTFPEVLFANFESKSFAGDQKANWTTTGDAFAKGPISGPGGPSQKLKGQEGKQTANSFVGTDRVTGALTSPPFVIEQSGISFLVAGGKLTENVGVNLLVDGKTVRSTAGDRSDRMQRKQWLVEDLIGKTATISIVDHATGGWGHIVVDDIRFVDADASLPLVREINQLAAHFQLKPKTLRKWIRFLHQSDLDAIPSALQNAIQFSQISRQRTPDAAIEALEKQELQASAAQLQLADAATVIGDFSSGIPDSWSSSGQSFDSVSAGEGILWKDRQPVVESECVSSANLSVKQRGSLFSPTFTIDGDQVLVQIAGKAAGLRLVIDGYVMHEFTPLLFSGTKTDVNTDGEFRWLSLAGDTRRYTGHRAHLEIRDDNDGWFAVRRVVMPHKGKTNAVKKLLNTKSVFASTTLADDLAWRNKQADDLSSVIKSLLPESKISTRSQGTWLKQIGLDENADAQRSTPIFDSWVKLADQVASPTRVMAMLDGSPENERVFIRGNHKSLGDEVPRNILTALRRNAADFKPVESASSMEGSGRLQLAMRVTDRNNPLTSRVAVNRIWHHLFGRGLVSSTDNFGVMGMKPSHPELLDYLAAQFMNKGWSIKSTIKDIVLSRTYRMQSRSSAEAEQIDPTNRYFHRAEIRRLSAESIRDSLLAVAGELKDEQFGAPVPIHLTAFMQGRGRPGTDGPLDGRGRRSIYLKINRNFLSPIMTAFDSPTPFTTIGRRNISNVPAQALILLNNEFITEITQRWANKLNAEELSTKEKISTAWLQLYGFSPTEAELAPLLQYVADADESDSDQMILADLLHALVNGKQFLYLR